ncbi:MAG: hypothetical protein C5B55_01135 [Blastocatellia bacterium]|nr:MAG: hypothetical protein C5B55_01135 [Blastocatellia bacterium]
MSWWFFKNKTRVSEADKAEEDSAADSVHPAAASLLDLQRAAGNQSVQHLVGGKDANRSSRDKESDANRIDTLIDSSEERDRAGIHLHTDNSAAKSADSLGAAAYTQGRDIYFGRGKYAPFASEGRELLAHELTHALLNEPSEQSTRLLSQTDIVSNDDPSEREADSIGRYPSSARWRHVERMSLPTPGSIHRAPLTEAEVAQKLHDAIAGVGVDEPAIIDLLKSLNRDATKIKKVKDAYAARFRSDLEAEIRLSLSGDAQAQALFHLNAPPPAKPETSLTPVKAGTEKLKEKVGDGEVSVHTEVEYKVGEATRTGGFSIGYSGGKSEESRWIQFLWSEILSTQTDGSVKHVAATGLPVQGGRTVDLTTDPTSPKYHVDSAKTDTPLYEVGGINIRTTTGTTIYDRPGEFSDIIAKQFDAGATKVIEKDHFDDFLVREYKTIYRVSLVVTWEYTSKTSVTRTTTFQSGSAATGMPSDFKRELVKEYPRFDYIQ